MLKRGGVVAKPHSRGEEVYLPPPSSREILDYFADAHKK